MVTLIENASTSWTEPTLSFTLTRLIKWASTSPRLTKTHKGIIHWFTNILWGTHNFLIFLINLPLTGSDRCSHRSRHTWANGSYQIDDSGNKVFIPEFHPCHPWSMTVKRKCKSESNKDWISSASLKQSWASKDSVSKWYVPDLQSSNWRHSSKEHFSTST